MLQFKKFFNDNKILIMIILIVLICSIAIAFGVYAQITNKGVKPEENMEIENNYEDLKNNFQDIFTNTINKEPTANLNINYDELLYCKYNINKEDEGKYKIEVKIPQFKGEGQVLQKINQEIFDVFGREVGKIANNVSEKIMYNVDYVSYVNGNIISLVIMCKYKSGANPQRIIVQTYNYDIEKDKLLDIEEIINYKNLDKDNMQKKVREEIKDINNKKKTIQETIQEQGYNVYVRDEESEIYEIDNTPNFFLGKNNYLYFVYAYGNNKYTSEMDLVIF